MHMRFFLSLKGGSPHTKASKQSARGIFRTLVLFSAGALPPLGVISVGVSCLKLSSLVLSEACWSSIAFPLLAGAVFRGVSLGYNKEMFF